MNEKYLLQSASNSLLLFWDKHDDIELFCFVDLEKVMEYIVLCHGVYGKLNYISHHVAHELLYKHTDEVSCSHLHS